MADFQELFIDFVHTNLSTFDVRKDEPENFYHALVLGMLVGLYETHEVRSNRESGTGRYDVMLIPKDTKLPGIVIELKRADKDTPKFFERAIAEALEQMKARQYGTELRARGITKTIELAIVFAGKNVVVEQA